jgi:hypothetical protein
VHDPHAFLEALTVVLCVAAVTTLLFQRLRQPVVFGYLLAGRTMDRIGVQRGLPLVVFLWSTAAVAHGWCAHLDVAARFSLRYPWFSWAERGLVLITLAVVIEGTALDEGWLNAVVFVVTVFAVHRGLAVWCAHSTWIRHLVRGKPSVLVRDGRVIEQALNREGVSRDELQAGLRKLGHDSPDAVKLTVLEETGHISAVGADDASQSVTPERLNP